jgi:hypothetical protein
MKSEESWRRTCRALAWHTAVFPFVFCRRFPPAAHRSCGSRGRMRGQPVRDLVWRPGLPSASARRRLESWRCGWHSRLIDECECVLSSPSRGSLLYCFPNGIMISSESLSCPSRIHGAKGLRWQSYNVCRPTTKDESQALAPPSCRIAPSAGNSKLEMVKRLLPFRAEPWSFGHESKNGRPSFGQQACSTPGRLARDGVGRNLSDRRRPFT